MSAERRPVLLRDVLEPVRRPVHIEDELVYRALGVRLYGNGTFLKEAKPGAQISTKTMNAIEPGDIVYSKLFAWKGSFAVVSDACKGGIASTEFPTYAPDTDLLLPEFFALWSARRQVWNMASEASAGTTEGSRNRLAPEDFLDLEIDLPPLAEQQVIVEGASIAGRAVRAWACEVEAADVALRVVRDSLLCQGASKKDWITYPLNEVAEIRSGITKGRKARGELIECPFIRAANVQTGFLDLAEIKTLPITEDEITRFSLAEGDLLLVEGSGSPARLGSGWLWEGQIGGPVVCQNHVFRVRANREKILPRFLAHAVHAGPSRAYFSEAAKTTSGLATINKTQVSGLRIAVPPIPIQQRVADILDTLREARLEALSAERGAAQVRSALVEELVTGARFAPRLAA